MKRFLAIFILIVTLCTALFFTMSFPFVSDGPEAVDGELDFRGTDFTASVYNLNGQWEFYYSCLYTPEDFRVGVSNGRELITLPGSWAALGYPEAGHGTYRLTIRIAPEEIYLLYIPEIISSAVIWGNGRELYRAGQPGSSEAGTVSNVRNEILAVSAEDGVLELVVQAANYSLTGSGLYYPMMIGRDTVMLHHLFWQRIVAAAAMGGILLIGVYHLFLYLFRRRERLYMVYSVTCFVTVLRLAMETNSLVQYFYREGLNVWLSRCYLLMFALHSICICLFMLETFSIRLSGLFRRVVWVCFIIPVLGVFTLPNTAAIACLFLALIPNGMSAVLAVRSGKIGRDPYRLLYLFSLVIFIIYAPLTKTVFEAELYIPGVVSNLFLIISQCVMLSRSYADAHDQVERVNENLERLVEERTTQLKDTNRQLAASQAALREMISNISHDLKTPLTVLNNYLELLGDETIASSDQERTEYLGIAYHKNLDIQRLIHNLFEVTRMEGGTAIYHLEWVSACDLMAEAGRKYADLVCDKGLSFPVEVDGTIELKIDKNKIWSVMDNLIYNALRHTPEGGRISLCLYRDGDRAVLAVCDTGEGIGEGHLPHIFERFYKVSPERGEKDGSSGLGLYIVKTTVEAMEGTVEVESTPGKGTMFTMRFLARDWKDGSKTPGLAIGPECRHKEEL